MEQVTAFAGIVAFDGAPIDGETQDRVTRATALHPGRTVIRRREGALFVQRNSSSVVVRADELPAMSGGDSRALFVALARLDNREELAAALGLTREELARTQDALLAQRTIARWGDAGVARMLGAFAFARWDPAAGHLLLGRDCLGNRPLFFHRGPRFTAFATSLRGLMALPDVPRDIDEITLANFLALNLAEERRTFYRGIERVPSRTVVTIDRARIDHRHYWAPNLDAAPPYSREEDYIERARELLDQAVAAAIRDTPRVAVSMSGGLDSSAIAATAARLGSAEKITCFTLVPPAGMQIDLGRFRYLDERDKVASLGRMHPALDIRLIAPESIHPFTQDDTRFFARAAMPGFGPANMGWFAHLHDAVAEAGHSALLIGNLGNFGLTWSGVFSLISLLRARRWGGFLHELRATARESGRSLARSLAGDVLIPAAPETLRRIISRMRGRDPDSVARHSALNPAVIAEFDLVRRWRTHGFDPCFGRGDWNAARHRAYRLFDHNQIARDTGAMWHDIRGFELRDPHADRRLLEFTLSVPEAMFARDGIPRSFARAALADRLPREILDERLKGAQAPTWFRTLDARRHDIANDIERLDASPLARRLIDLPRLKRLLAEWPKDEHAAQERVKDYRLALNRGVHVGRFVRWVEGGNA